MADYTSYERITHTPIVRKSLPVGEEGRYDGPTLVDMLKNTLPLMQGRELPNNGTITIDPSSPSYNENRDLRHEAIHAALMNAPKSINPALTESSNYAQIAQRLMQTRQMQNPAHEVAAYMGAYDPAQSQVPQDWRDEYIGKLQGALGKINPKLAQTMQKLSQ